MDKIKTNYKDPLLDITLEGLCHCFNVASKILYFEGNPNAVSTLVRKYENRHLVESEQAWLRELHGGLVRPEVLQDKYEIARNKEKTSRTVIYVYDNADHPDSSSGSFIISKPRVFADDIDTVAVFVPESYIDIDAKDENRYKAYTNVFLALIAGNYGLYKDENRNFSRSLARIFTKSLMVNTDYFDKVFNTDDERDVMINGYYDQFSNFIGLDEYNGTLAISVKPNTTEYLELKGVVDAFYNDFQKYAWTNIWKDIMTK